MCLQWCWQCIKENRNGVQNLHKVQAKITRKSQPYAQKLLKLPCLVHVPSLHNKVTQRIHFSSFLPLLIKLFARECKGVDPKRALELLSILCTIRVLDCLIRLLWRVMWYFSIKLLSLLAYACIWESAALQNKNILYICACTKIETSPLKFCNLAWFRWFPRQSGLRRKSFQERTKEMFGELLGRGMIQNISKLLLNKTCIVGGWRLPISPYHNVAEFLTKQSFIGKGKGTGVVRMLWLVPQ